MHSKSLIASFLIINLLGGLALAMGEKPKIPAAPKAAAQAEKSPDFFLRDLNGKAHELSDYRGKYVFLNFWATWCPPCRAEMPSMQKLFDAWDKNKYVMLAVNIGQGVDEVRDFANENKYTFMILLDTSQEVARRYMVRGIPTTYFIDRNGKIIMKAVGSKEWTLKEIEKIAK